MIGAAQGDHEKPVLADRRHGNAEGQAGPASLCTEIGNRFAAHDDTASASIPPAWGDGLGLGEESSEGATIPHSRKGASFPIERSASINTTKVSGGNLPLFRQFETACKERRVKRATLEVPPKALMTSSVVRSVSIWS